MPPGDIAPVLVTMTLAVVTGGVLILRPITKKIGSLIEVAIEERRRRFAAPQTPEMPRLVELLEGIDERLSSLEEKQRFTDAILHAEAVPVLPRSTKPPE